jgi:hypothetical protein
LPFLPSVGILFFLYFVPYWWFYVLYSCPFMFEITYSGQTEVFLH